MKFAKMPMMVHAAMSMISIQKLSWMAGQWYLWMCPMRRSTTIESVVTVDAIAGAGRQSGWGLSASI